MQCLLHFLNITIVLPCFTTWHNGVFDTTQLPTIQILLNYFIRKATSPASVSYITMILLSDIITVP